AKLVETVQDIADELGGAGPAASARTAPPARPAPPHPLLDALGFDPLHLDALQARTGMDAASLNAQLLELELDGRVARVEGGRFQRLR
ncbi:DprA-like winged helix domain-containing protein, partial [Bordetella pertussis]